ncbi:unnamed protein product [Cylindrotheca closterium]|uniref:Subtilisin n=1 Tax=Cylindrotheca closterium TaxID=2856 RepID=A0AAD2G9B3_9STRA|nr:unnamed protein product [Cylindrotheca closterium]
MKLNIILVLVIGFAAPVARAECRTCPDGIEFRDADPLGDGFYQCTNVDNFYLFSIEADSAECFGAQYDVMSVCCPSQVKDIAKDNACGWCPNGVTNLESSVEIPFQEDPVTCGQVMVLVAAGSLELGICGLASSVASICCPGDEGGGGGGFFSCGFCVDGIEYPLKINPEAENFTCTQVQAASLLANETVCDTLVKPLEDSCCPNTNSSSECDFCSDGLDNPNAELPLTGITCEQFQASAASVTDSTQCEFAFKPAETLCCPSTTNVVGCDFCSAGLENPTAPVPFVDELTCQDLQDSALFATDCTSTKLAEAFCCPSISDNTDRCEFCPGGLDDPNEDVPLLGGLTCKDFQDGASFVGNSTECEESIKPLEGLCCPNATDNFQCDWCSGEAGVEFPELEFPGIGLKCDTIVMLVPAVTYEELCDQYKAAESLCCPASTDAVQCDFCTGPSGLEFPEREIDDSGLTCQAFATLALAAPNQTFCSSFHVAEELCCPSSTGVSLPPVAMGDYCYICGSADVEMTKPDFQPYAFGGSDDPDDQKTCAQLEESLNAGRSPGESCINTISGFTFRFSPSICGCKGVTPPNPCDLCSGRSVNRDAQMPGENFTCGEGFDFIQHVSPAFCSNPEINLYGMEGVCCTDILESETISAASCCTRCLVAFASLFIGLIFD